MTMDLVNIVTSSWCPKYQKIWEKTHDKKDMFVHCQFEETTLTDVDECKMMSYICKNCKYTLSIFSTKKVIEIKEDFEK